MMEQNKRSFFWRVEGLVVLSAFVVSIAGTFFIAYSSIYEPPPIIDRNRSIVNPIVERGSDITIKNAYIETKACASNFIREMWSLGDPDNPDDDIRFYDMGEYRPGMDFDQDNTRIKRRKFTTRNIRIPWNAPLGKAEYDVTVEWFCNPLQRLYPHVESLPPIEFEIVERGSIKPKPSGQ